MLRSLKSFARDALSRWHSLRRAREIERTLQHVTAEQISEGLRHMGVGEGDVLFVHSSLKSLGFVRGGPSTVIQGIRDAVGPSGTVILPTYYMPAGTVLGACQMEGYRFDPRVHGTTMGALPSAFLAMDGVQRSIHPTHSVSAVGKHARFITEAHHLAPSIFGTGSPWQRFHELDGKVLGLGVSMGPITFYHLLEDTLGERFPVDIWVERTFYIPCCDWNGEEYLVPVRPFRPELMPSRIDHPSRSDLRDHMANSLLEAGLLRSGQVGQANAWTVQAKGFLTHLEHLATQGITVYGLNSARSV